LVERSGTLPRNIIGVVVFAKVQELVKSESPWTFVKTIAPGKTFCCINIPAKNSKSINDITKIMGKFGW
jgi:hypothetical protein